MATRGIEVSVGERHRFTAFAEELLGLFLFYVKIFLVTTLLSGALFLLYAAYKTNGVFLATVVTISMVLLSAVAAFCYSHFIDNSDGSIHHGTTADAWRAYPVRGEEQEGWRFQERAAYGENPRDGQRGKGNIPE